MNDTLVSEPDDRILEPDGPVVLVNTFHAKPGKLDEFIELQLLEQHRMAATAAASGWRGSRLHRSLDGRTAIVVAVFESLAAQEAWSRRTAHSDQVGRIETLVERVESRTCAMVFEAGRI
ncbi:antibiotic biosynthesis monooxygenase family protein [Mesorhizobium xinjiangense]|uniref:antibiotic biosynthesis monooxygenase family protein n=1 Tax=Mesorhizobium xinjiangense TaxID=2678685 RepID=UPI0012EDD98D|nr:antibiotic biosynthesis monooxygenase family protein [Mesorhizobium xinjiangense]